MKKIYDSDTITAYVQNSCCHAIFEELSVHPFIAEYKKGELVTSPFHCDMLFQIVVCGSLNIYFIRDDGTRYSLSSGTTDYILGDMEIFQPRSNNVFAEAAEDTTCIAFSIDQNKEKLLANSSFLRLVCNSLSMKMGTITATDAAPASLSERVLSYMKYKCPSGTLKGLEQAAFHLHCSSRQLQRIMNQFERDGIVEKVGKGAYQYKINPAKISAGTASFSLPSDVQ